MIGVVNSNQEIDVYNQKLRNLTPYMTGAQIECMRRCAEKLHGLRREDLGDIEIALLDLLESMGAASSKSIVDPTDDVIYAAHIED